MSNLLRLLLRRWWVSRQVHLTVMLISVAVLSGWLLYWGYVEAAGQTAALRVRVPVEPTDLILSADGSRAIKLPAYIKRVYGYKQLLADTAYGRLSLGAVTERDSEVQLPQPMDQLLWLRQGLADQWQLQIGDSLPLRLLQEFAFLQLSARVGGFYDDSVFLPDLLADGKWLASQQVSLPAAETLFYNRASGNSVSADQQNSLWLTQLPAGVRRIDGASMVEAGKQLATDALRSGGDAAILLFLFLVLGVGTFSLLIYLDGRRELAVLKSLGLRPREVRALFCSESLLTALLSWFLAAVFVNLLADCLTIPVIIAPAVFARSLLWLLAAVLLATAFPCLLGQRASVVDLLFNRSVPLFSSTRKGLSRQYPALEALLAAGYSCIKLDGQFDGVCLGQLGRAVKPGETVAWESLAWGLGERHYLAACAGTIVQCDLAQGLIVIEPQQSGSAPD